VGVFLSGLAGRSSVMMMNVRMTTRGIATRGIAMLACCWSFLFAVVCCRFETAAQRCAVVR
jgi:tartrate dehydratase alpha subunit/fumarate hydratase class I-like protein